MIPNYIVTIKTITGCILVVAINTEFFDAIESIIKVILIKYYGEHSVNNDTFTILKLEKVN